MCVYIYIYIYIYIFISKNWSVTFIVVMLLLSYISVHAIILFLFRFSIIFFNIYSFFFKYLYFLPLLPFHLPTTFYFNITLHLSLHLPLFCLFLFTPFHYKFAVLSSILYIVFPHQKKKKKALSQFYGGFFIFLASLL